MDNERPPLIRPPSEADALILQATYGCSHNRCGFCVTYRKRRFEARPLAHVTRDIDDAAEHCQGVRKVFLGDGDPLTLSADHLVALLDHLRLQIPSVRRVSAYASPKNFRDKSGEDLLRLREAGLTQVYIGFESGDDEILKRIDKDTTHDEIVDACDMLNRAGIKISAIIILGLGGPALSLRHATNSARLINRTRPRFASALTLMLAPRRPSYEEVVALPEWRELTPREVLEECRVFIDHIEADGVIFRSNHVSNYLALAGTLQKSKPRLLGEIDAVLAVADNLPKRPVRF
jgi:radical SAM superfamily enzyme YgiQ (UPF0313 family)